MKKTNLKIWYCCFLFKNRLMHNGQTLSVGLSFLYHSFQFGSFPQNYVLKQEWEKDKNCENFMGKSWGSPATRIYPLPTCLCTSRTEKQENSKCPLGVYIVEAIPVCTTLSPCPTPPPTPCLFAWTSPPSKKRASKQTKVFVTSSSEKNPLTSANSGILSQLVNENVWKIFKLSF